MGAMRSIGVRLRLWTDQYRQDGKQAERTNEGIAESGRHAKKDLEGLSTGMAIAGAVFVAAAGAMVFATAKFDKQMSEVGAVAGATGEQLGELRDAALEAGAATSFSASQAAEAESELAKAGVVTADILGGALRGSLDLAAAGTLDLATAATIAASAMNTFDLKGKDVGHIADVLAAASNKSAASVEDLGLGLQQVGLVAAQVGFGLEETVGILAAFADRGLRGSDGATSLKTALLRLAAPEAAAAEQMKRLGISLYDSTGQMVGAVEIAGQLEKALKDLTPAERNAALQTIFGSDAIRAANVLYAEGAAGIQEYIDAVNDQGAAGDVAAAKLDNLAGDVEALTGSLETLFITSGSGASGGLRFLVQGLTDVVNAVGSLPAPVLATTVAVVGLTGVLLLGAAGWIKYQAAMARAATGLAAMGPLGARAAVGLNLIAANSAKAALGVIGLVAAMALLDDGSVHVKLSRQLVDDLGGSLDAMGKTLGDTAENVDRALSEMAKNGEAERVLAMVADAAKRAGLSVDQALRQLPQTAEALKGLGDMSVETAQQTAELEKTNIALAGSFGAAANEVDGLRKEFERYNGAALKSRDATRDAEAAVDNLIDALEESNGSLDVHEEKGRAAEAAVDALAQAAIDAAQAKYDETHSVEAANAVYQDYIEQLRQSLRNAGMAEDAIQALIDQIARVPTYKAITLDVKTQLDANYWAAYGAHVAATSRPMRWGGIQHAEVGLLREATIATKPAVSWAEPATGGEAFVPRRGDYGRSMGIMQTAASWYNADVVPRGGWSAATSASGPISLNITVSADPGLGGAVLDGLRFDVTQVGGGDVQTHIGRRGRL